MDEEEDDECRYSCVLVLSALAQLVVYLVAVGFTVQALQEGSIFKIFEIEEVSSIVFADQAKNICGLNYSSQEFNLPFYLCILF